MKRGEITECLGRIFRNLVIEEKGQKSLLILEIVKVMPEPLESFLECLRKSVKKLGKKCKSEKERPRAGSNVLVGEVNSPGRMKP